MLTLHMLGHVHVTQDGKPVNISSKATALLSYLALEKQSHPREHLAELLWDNPEALGNLRVELNRLKHQGLSPFPARQPMLSLQCQTDLDMWEQEAEKLTERDLSGWLSLLRGPPLGGLEELGSTSFRAWVDQQRDSINERVETVMGGIYSRFSRHGQNHLTELIRSRADLLSIQLPEHQVGLELGGTELPFKWPHQQGMIQRLLNMARKKPHLLLLHGRSGSKRTALKAAIGDSDWRFVDVQASEHRHLVFSALAQQLSRLLPPELQPALHPLFKSGADLDADLIHLGYLISRAHTPLVLTIHGIEEAHQWLANGVRFAMDIPTPLLIVLAANEERPLDELRRKLGQLDWERLYRIGLPALGAAQVDEALQAIQAQQVQHPQSSIDVDQRYQQAAQLAQHTEGCPLYIRTLVREGIQPVSPFTPQPSSLTDMQLALLNHLPADLRTNLARLAQVQDRFSPALAGVLLGECSASTLQQGVQRGILVPASQREDISLPSLATWTSDAEAHLTFSYEATRIALATTLLGSERHALRCQLAEYYLTVQPALAVMYAERAQLPDLAAAARAALPSPLYHLGRPAACQFVPAPPVSGQPRREARTANGYRVALDQGHIEVLRRGRWGAPTLLTMHLNEVPSGTWLLTARLDVFNDPGGQTSPPPFALGVGDTLHPTTIFTVEAPPIHSDEQCEFGGLLPMGRWFQLSGQGGGGPLRLSVRATNIALRIGALTWNERPVLTDQTRLED